MLKIGNINNSAKHKKAFNYDEHIYNIFLAPAKMSGHEVCPGRNEECTILCLNESGMNRMSMNNEFINKSRIQKTKLFYSNRELFVRVVINEINYYKSIAELSGSKFSVRLNNTSDLSPETFYIIDNGKKKNILEIFPDVQFYDYTKVFSRLKLTEKYSNYDLTFSYSGYNETECQKALELGYRVAVVFNKVPSMFWGLNVVSGDNYDMRYKDPKNCIIGLKFKKVRNKLQENYKFVIQ